VFFDRFIDSIRLLNTEIEVVTNFSVSGNAVGRLAFDMNPLKYSYGLALFFALIFSNFGSYFKKRDTESNKGSNTENKVVRLIETDETNSISDELINKFLKCLFAYFIISIAQVWGISFDIIRHLLFEFNGAYAAHFHFSPLQMLLVSYGSQLGFLLLPSLTPILLWIYLENKQFKKLIGHS
jgi:hypothetical protein